MSNQTISLRQYMAVVFVALFSPASRLIPRASIQAAGASSWVGVFVAAPILLLLILLVRRLLKLGGEENGLAGAFEAAIGKTAGKYVTLVFGLWLVLYGGFLLRSGGERLVSTVYTNGSVFSFMAAMLLPAVIAARGKTRFAIRCGCVIMLAFGLTLILIFAASVPSVRWEDVWPPELGGETLLSALPIVDVLSPWVYFSFLRGEVESGNHAVRRAFLGIAAPLFAILVLLITTIGILGVGLSEKLQFPFFVMIKNLRIFHVVERIEALVVMIWMMTDFVCIMLTLMSAAEAFRSCFGGKRKGYVLTLAALMLLTGASIVTNSFSFQRFSERIIPGIHLILVFALLPAVLGIGVMRQRGGRGTDSVSFRGKDEKN